jgi:hypothetical protein
MEYPTRLIVMKVGVHLGEPWEAILARKLAEEQAAGVAYWGYGGSVCHPLTQVQPFAREAGPVTVLLVRTASDFWGTSVWATAASGDGRSWAPLPHGVRTSGRYALVLRSLQATREALDLGAYAVAIGSKAGTPLPRYLRGRVDKACARLAAVPGEAHPLWAVARAELVAPYAVLLRTG